MKKFSSKYLYAYATNLNREEHLLRLARLGFKPPSLILLYLFRTWFGWSEARIILKLFDVPLRELAEHAEKKIGREYSLSQLSVQAYLAALRFQLDLTCEDYFHGQTVPRGLTLKAGVKIGDTTLRQWLLCDRKSIKRAVLKIALRVRVQSFSWNNPEVWNIFCEARYKDIYNHILLRVHFDTQAAEELTLMTWGDAHRDLARFDPIRAALIAFVKNKARFVLLRYFCAECQGAHGEPFDGKHDADQALERFLSQDKYKWDPDTLTAVRLQLLEVLFDGKSKPFELLAFMLVRLLERPRQGEWKPRGKRTKKNGWKPKDILAEFFGKTLREVTRWVEAAFIDATKLPEKHVRENFRKLYALLDQPIRRMKNGRQVTKDAEPFQALLGETNFGSYFPGQEEKDRRAKIVTAWSTAQRHLVTDVLRNGQGPLRDLLREIGPRRPRRKAAKKSSRSGKEYAKSAPCPKRRSRKKKPPKKRGSTT